MNKVLNIKKILVVLSVIAISFTAFPAINYVGAWAACLSCSPISSKVVEENGQIMFTLKYTNDINKITLTQADLRLDGFTANINIGISGNNRVITLSNIKNKAGSSATKRVYVSGGTAVSSDGQLANAVQTESFTIKETQQEPTDNVAPVATISGPSVSQVYAGGTVVYKITYTDNVGIKAITLNANDVRLSGFTASKNVSISGNVATITLSNIQGTVGGNKTIYVSGGTAIDAQGNLCNAVTGSAFSIVNKSVTPDNPDDGNNNNNNTNTDNNNNNTNNGKPSDWVANPNTGK